MLVFELFFPFPLVLEGGRERERVVGYFFEFFNKLHPLEWDTVREMLYLDIFLNSLNLFLVHQKSYCGRGNDKLPPLEWDTVILVNSSRLSNFGNIINIAWSH